MICTNTPLLTKRMLFTEIDPSAIRHPLDRLAADQLKKLRGFDTLVAKFIEFRYERLQYVLNTASNVRVSPKQLPSLYSMLRESCAILDMPEPELYVSQRPGVNAHTSGHTKPYIILYSGLLDLMDDDEVMAVIAHELGHIKCGHVLYMTMAQQIDNLVVLVKEFLPAVGQLVGMGIDWTIKIALLNWARRSELSADRAALLVIQQPKPCISMLAKLAGGTVRFASQLDAEEFLRQALTYAEERDHGANNRFYHHVAGMYQGTHPFAVERVKYLNDWIKSPEYRQMLAGNYPRLPRQTQGGSSSSSGQGKFCTNCRRLLDATDKFCSSCGHPIVNQ
jgi:Zn-dependent protease with chaperone function